MCHNNAALCEALRARGPGLQHSCLEIPLPSGRLKALLYGKMTPTQAPVAADNGVSKFPQLRIARIRRIMAKRPSGDEG